MASRAFQPQSIDVLLSAIPSLPRPLLDRLVARMIEHLDEIDGDPDLEPDNDDEREEDCCPAGDDGCGPIYMHGTRFWGSYADEPMTTPARYSIDQSAGPIT